MDPKMRKLVDYLLANYRPATATPLPSQMPPMTDDQRRTDAFVRGAPAHLPMAKPRGKNAAMAAFLRSGASRPALNVNPIDD